MKKPYSKGDYVEFKVGKEIKKGFIKQWFIAADTNRFIKYMPAEYLFTISTKSGKEFSIFEKNIIRKLPILRDKNGRFSKKKPLSVSIKNYEMVNGKPKLRQSSKVHWKSEIEAQPSWKKYEKELEKDCSCFNCDKCAEQMRAYYERTGELKNKTERKTCSYCNYQYGGIDDGSHEVVCPTFLKTKTEEKKPSDYIDKMAQELIEKRPEMPIEDVFFASIVAYLDEQFEKGK